MSAGELFDLLMPAAFALSAVISTWVLASARKRFSIYSAIGWAVGTLFLPLIVFPLYLVTIMWRKSSGPPQTLRYVLPLLYAVIVLGAITAFFYFDRRSVDAHLARATRAELLEHTATAISEYQQALALEDSPHTRKLLAIELTKGGYLSQAVSEFRLARERGEPDDAISFWLGNLLDRMNLPEEAQVELEKFLASETCRHVDYRCAAARDSLRTRSHF